MKKTPTIFIRDPKHRSLVLPEQNEECAWVFAGEGEATKKYDGSCCLVENGQLWKRREVKPGKDIPEGFRLVASDAVTGKVVGWMPVTNSREDRFHVLAFQGDFEDGTYELCGPKVQGNKERFKTHCLVSHRDAIKYANVERTFEGIRDFLEPRDIEGLVFHHSDGRMAKIKKRDFGMERVKVSENE